jgi:hypothetical protein
MNDARGLFICGFYLSMRAQCSKLLSIPSFATSSHTQLEQQQIRLGKLIAA